MSTKSAKERILLLVDEVMHSAIAAPLADDGFHVEAASSSSHAQTRLATETFELAIIDLGHAEGGPDFVRAALEADADIAIIVLSDLADATTAAICLKHGAFDYLTKPARIEDLRLSVDRALRRRGTMLQQEEISAWLKQELVKRTQELDRERKKLEQVNVATLGALINVLEAKDPDFVGHSQRVSELAATIADEMGLSDDEIEAVRAAGRLHDIGKIGIRDSVLQKKGPLTPEEYEHVKSQVIIGFRILSPLSHLGTVIEYVRSHHEHWDGSGYPEGSKGDEIPLGARVVGAAEIYDAITTSRPYQETLEPEEALVQMRRLSGTKLDPEVVNALGRAIARHNALVFIDGRNEGPAGTVGEDLGGDT